MYQRGEPGNRHADYMAGFRAGYAAGERQAAQGAAPRAEGLDVRSLATALRNLYQTGIPGEFPVKSSGGPVMELLEPLGKNITPWEISAARIIAEYARLSRPSDERVPGEEDR